MTDANQFNDFNAGVIAEFRANAGKVGGPFEGATVVLITHTGAKSGVQRTAPLVCTIDEGRVVIIASKAGAPTNPDWYHNLVANPVVTVELGTDTYQATAVEVTGDERGRLYDRQAEVMPQYKDYELATTRIIPVFVLERIVD